MKQSTGVPWLKRKLSISLIICALIFFIIHQAPLLLVVHNYVFPVHVRHMTLVEGNKTIGMMSNSTVTRNNTSQIETKVNTFVVKAAAVPNTNANSDFLHGLRKSKPYDVLPEGIKPIGRNFLDLDAAEKIDGDHARIPRIIHQFWDAAGLPPAFKFNVKSWVDNHPQWEYWFWQAQDVRLLLNGCYPDYFQLYKKYPQTVNRADAMRYFVLYTFGGLYLDLDMVALKPNDPLLKDAPCVLTEETYEHSVLLYERIAHPNLINAYMASRPRHPFFKMAIEDLPKSRMERSHLRRTGPFFIDHIYQVYNSSHFHSSEGVWRRPVDDVKILGAKLVMPTFDRGQDGNLHRKCINTRNRPQFYKDVCREFEQRRRSNKPYPQSYANHLWTHTYMAEAKWKSTPGIPIRDIVPHAVNVTEKLLKMCTQPS